jgi:transcriptional regulator GlxA family with amidase domain
VITAAAAPLGIHVRDRLKPRGFDVAGSGSAKARALIAQASGTDPANSVLRSFASAPIRATSSQRRIIVVVAKPSRDPALATVLD